MKTKQKTIKYIVFIFIITVLALVMFFAFYKYLPFLKKTDQSNLFKVEIPNKHNLPNIIIFIIDALRKDHLGCYGYERETSPNIDKLARESIVFHYCISSASWSKPCIGSLFTSLYPSQHGATMEKIFSKDNDIYTDMLSEKHITLAEVLKSIGYYTIGIGNNNHLRNYLGFGQGFHYYNLNAGKIKSVNKIFLNILKRTGKKPFFAYLHYIDVHRPYSPPPPYDSYFGNYSKHWDSLRNSLDCTTRFNKVNSGEIVLTADDVKYITSLYDGSIRYVDTELQKLLNKLKQMGHHTNTMIILSADHGEGLYERGFLAHPQDYLYDELINVPLIVKLPGKKLHKDIKDQVRTIDIYPSILDIIGARIKHRIEGVSFYPLITNNFYHPKLPAISEAKKFKIALRQDHYKYIYYQGDETRNEFYDLKKDPKELNNLIKKNYKKAEEMRKRIIEWKKLTGTYQFQAGKGVKLRKRDIEKLKALGYL